jgi:hypothetical protein
MLESLDAFSRAGGVRWRMQLDPDQRELQGCLPRGRWQLGHGGFGEGSRWQPRGKRGRRPWERQGWQLEDDAPLKGGRWQPQTAVHEQAVVALGREQHDERAAGAAQPAAQRKAAGTQRAAAEKQRKAKQPGRVRSLT